MAREYFCAYHSLIESLEPFSDVEKGRLFSAALVYSRDSAEPQLTGNERFIWPTIKAMIDRDRAAYAAKCEKNKANVSERYRTNTTVYERSQEKEKEEDKDKDKEKEKEKDNISSPNGERDKGRAARFVPPSVEDVAAYCKERDNGVDANAFVDFYSSKGWRVGSQPMKDWKAAVRTWERRDGRGQSGGKHQVTAEDKQKQAEADAVAMEQIRRLREKMRNQSARREV